MRVCVLERAVLMSVLEELKGSSHFVSPQAKVNADLTAVTTHVNFVVLNHLHTFLKMQIYQCIVY